MVTRAVVSVPTFATHLLDDLGQVTSCRSLTFPLDRERLKGRLKSKSANASEGLAEGPAWG